MAHGKKSVNLAALPSVARLRALFGNEFDSLSATQVQALVSADTEGEVSNRRLQSLCAEHPAEITKVLQGLTEKGFLEQTGQNRGATYRLPTWAYPRAQGTPPLAPGTPPRAQGTPPLAPGTPPLAPGAPPLAPGVPPCPPERDPHLVEIARPAYEKKKLSPALLERIICELCHNRHLTAESLGQLLNRDKENLRENHLKRLVDSGKLKLQFPDQPNHPRQAYTTSSDWRDE